MAAKLRGCWAATAALVGATLTACGGGGERDAADSVSSTTVSATVASSTTTAPASTTSATTVLLTAGTGPAFGGAPPTDWRPFVGTDLTMAVPPDWFDLKPSVTDSPATKASILSQVPGATEANVDSFVNGLDLWLGHIGPTVTELTMMMASTDPELRYPPDEDVDNIGIFAETLRSNPPIDGVEETVVVSTIGEQPVVVADRSPSTLGDRPATERTYWLIEDRYLVSVTFRSSAPADFALWEQLVATVEVTAGR